MNLRPVTNSSAIAPNFDDSQTDVEERLAQIWAILFQISTVDREDNFFELGGDSLLGAKLMIEIEREFGQRLPVNSVFQSPTVRQLAARLRRRREQISRSQIITFQAGANRPGLFCLPGAGEHFLYCEELAASLDPIQPLYGVREQERTSGTTLKDMAAHSIEQIRTLQPRGPYYLSGYSFGGIVALEVAQQLLAQGHRVELLALLDPSYPVGFRPLRSWLNWLPRALKQHLFHWLAQLDMHSYRLSQLTTGEKINYLKRRVHLIVNQAKHRAALSPAEQRLRETMQLMRTYQPLIEQYIPQRYPNSMHLFLSEERQQDPYQVQSWSRLSQGSLDVYVLPGNHQTVTQKNNIQAFAQQVSCLLNCSSVVPRSNCPSSDLN